MEHFNMQQQTFMLFFAIFWGTIASVQGRWKAFQLPLVGRVPVVNCRVCLSFLFLNLFPLMFFAYCIAVLTKAGVSARPYIAGLQLVINGVLPAFAVFGFYRLWLGTVEKWPDSFYAKARDPKCLDKKYWHVEPIYSNQHQEGTGEPCVNIGIDSANRNIIWAIGYISVGLIAPWLRFCI
jgi:hypothetical protein